MPARPDSRPSPAWQVIAWSLVLCFVVASVAVISLERSITAYPPDPSLVESTGLFLGFGWFVVIGAIVVSQQPRNAMGWLLATTGLTVAVFAAGNSLAAYVVLERGYEPGLAISLLAWPNNWYWFAALGLIFVFIPLLFPDGRLPSRRWRIVGWSGALGMVGICVAGAVAGEIGFQVSMTSDGPGASIPNPLGVPGLAHVEQLPVMMVFGVFFLAAILGAFASLLVRFRRSVGTERQQIKWLVLAVALVPVSVGVEVLGGQIAEGLQGVGFVVAINAIPLAIGLAVLRYRLYDIDRIISRTLSYVLLTAVLAGVYVGGVIGLGAVLNSMGLGGGELVVAASTLAVAALFQPARRRLQSAVDRRFNRQRYDSEQVVGAFVQRLRDEVQIETLTADVHAVLTAAVHPSFVAVWTPSEHAR